MQTFNFIFGGVNVLALIAILGFSRRVKSIKPIDPAEWETTPVKDVTELKERLIRKLGYFPMIGTFDRDSSWESAERLSLEWVMRQIDGQPKEEQVRVRSKA